MGLKVREKHPVALGKGYHSCHLNTNTVACNGGKHTSAQAPLKGNEGVEWTGASVCRLSHMQGSG